MIIVECNMSFKRGKDDTGDNETVLLHDTCTLLRVFSDY